MERKKLCLVIPSLQAGGMERVMSELIQYYSFKKNLELHLVIYDNVRDIFYPVPESVLVHLPPFPFNNSARTISTFRTLLFLRKTVKSIKPSTILSFGEFWNSFVLLSLLGLPYPVFISDRCSPEKKFNTLHSLLRRLLYPKSKGIIAQTKMAKDYYLRFFHHKNIRIIGNPIRIISPKKENEKENIVLMVGRYINTKNQDKLIDLFLDLDIKGWKLILVGYDHLKQNISNKLEEIINRRNAHDRVILTGKQADVDSYYRRSKIFAFTSVSEGFPNVIEEAMSAGLPVIAFDCIAGPSELVIDNHNGFLIPLSDYVQFADKLRVIMKDEGLRMKLGRNAVESVKRFSIKVIAEEYLEFILGR